MVRTEGQENVFAGEGNATTGRCRSHVAMNGVCYNSRLLEMGKASVLAAVCLLFHEMAKWMLIFMRTAIDWKYEFNHDESGRFTGIKRIL